MKVTRSGRPSDKAFEGDILKKAADAALHAMEQKARGAAGSIVDPETGRHADVFVDRKPGNRVGLRTSGSPAFARLVEKRLGIAAGEIVSMKSDATGHPKAYLAHATEDKDMVRPIAEHLMSRGIEVWFDEWEIDPGESLRQKMEEGLGAMTHFMVILTPTSITKPWVAREIDVGMVRLVGGQSRFVPVLVGLDPKELPPFLQSMLYLKIDPTSEEDLNSLVDRLHGVSRKPVLGEAPQYVKPVPDGLAGWSKAAVAIGKHLVETSKHAMHHDPTIPTNELAAATGLGADELRIGILDLKDAGYLKEGYDGAVWPLGPMFVDFDEAYMPFNPSEDAATVANHMVTSGERRTDTAALAERLGWSPRRMNSAICYLERAGAVQLQTALAAAQWRAVRLIRDDSTLRFVRSRA